MNDDDVLEVVVYGESGESRAVFDWLELWQGARQANDQEWMHRHAVNVANNYIQLRERLLTATQTLFARCSEVFSDLKENEREAARYVPVLNDMTAFWIEKGSIRNAQCGLNKLIKGYEQTSDSLTLKEFDDLFIDFLRVSLKKD